MHWERRDRFAVEHEDNGRRKSLQIMPLDSSSSPTARPQDNDSAEDLTENKELKRGGMRITFKVRHLLGSLQNLQRWYWVCPVLTAYM